MTTPVLQLPSTGFFRIRQIIGDPGKPDAKKPIPPTPAILPISRSSWWEGVKAGRYPQPVKLGRATLWRVEDILALVAQIENTNEPNKAA